MRNEELIHASSKLRTISNSWLEEIRPGTHYVIIRGPFNHLAIMPFSMNPFQKHDVSDFPAVYVPLAQSQRNASVIADHAEKLGSFSQGKNLDDEAPSLGNDYSAYTGKEL